MAGFPDPPIFSYLMSGNLHGLHAYSFPALNVVPNAITQILYSPLYIDQYENAKYNPLDCVISCHQIPVATSTGNSVSYFMANGKQWDIPVSHSEVTSRYSTFNCGSVSISRTENNAEDYNKKITLHLPFCTAIEVPAVLCVGGTIQVRYTVDVLTGDCIAHVLTTNGANETALLSSTGNCAVTIPICAQIDKTQINLAHSVTNSVASVTSSLIAGALGSPMGVIGSVTGAIDSYYTAKETPVTATSTAISGNVVAMDYRTPYVTIVTPRTNNNRVYMGGSAYGNKRVGNCTGFIKYKNIEIGTLTSRANSNIVATAEEVHMIENMLKSGVYAE